MKRPLFTAAAAWMLGELFAEDIKYLLAVLVIFIFVALIKKRISKRHSSVFVEVIIIIIFLFWGRYALTKLRFEYQEYSSLTEGEYLLAEGKVEAVTKRDYGCQVILVPKKVIQINTGKGMPDKVKLLLEFEEEPGFKIGNQISVRGRKKEFYPCTNQGNFDEKEYYYTQKTAVKLSVEEYSAASGTYSEIREKLHEIQQLLCSNIDKSCGEEQASVLKAVIYGDRAGLDKEVKKLYVKNGVAHILAVSGLHMSIVGMGIYRLLRKRFNFFNSGIAGMAVIVCFGLMTGFSISVKRAIYMMILRMAADLCGRKYDFKSAVSFSVLLILIENPYAIYSAAFLLSCSAMLSVGFVYPEFELWLKKENKQRRKLLKSVLSGFLLWLVSLPVVAYFYFEVPTYAVFLNFLILPFLSVLFISGMAASFFMLVSWQTGVFVCGAGVFCVKIYDFLCRCVERLPYSSIVTGRPDNVKILLFYGILLLFIAVIRYCDKSRMMQPTLALIAKRKKLLPFVFFSFALLFVIYVDPPRSSLNISMIDVGQGDCILVENENGNTYLIDAGSSSVQNVAEYKIIPYLKCKGIGKLDYVMVSHGDSDHINGILEMLYEDKLEIQTLILPDSSQFQKEYEELVLLAKKRGTRVIYVQKDSTIEDNELCLEILSPNGGHYSDINDASMVMRLSYHQFSMYFTGDIGEETEKVLLPELISADIIKVPHHGSKNSSSWEFVEKINPCLALVSCGFNNQYGHPHSETLKRYQAFHTKIFVTAQTGCIEIKVPESEKGTVYYVSTCLPNAKQ